jgi:FtsZ-binding cell division protein ZapB
MVVKKRPTVLVFLVAILVLVFVTPVHAGPEAYRQCTDDQTCEIGEYLFDDDYTPITTADCNFTSRDPNGTLFLDDVDMTANSDGWYSYEVTTTGEEYGLYRSQICCTYLTEFICLDKSFEIASASAALSVSGTEIADAVWDAQTVDHNDAGSFGENLQNPSSLTADDIWSHPQRSLTSFGTLISDIWNYSTRSLTSFTSLITSIWQSSDRTLTDATLDSGSLATQGQVSEVSNQVDTVNTTINTINTNTVNSNTNTTEINSQITEISQAIQRNRIYLEQLVNAPIIETFIEEGEEIPDLQSKIRETKRVATSLFLEAQGLQTQIANLNGSWESSNYQLALSEVASASRVLGATTEDSVDPNNINSRINWLNKKWKSPVISNLSVQNTSAQANINSINREVKSYGKTFLSKQYLDIAQEHIDKINELIGQETDADIFDTLFGYIAHIEKISDALIQLSLEIDELQEEWNDLTNSEKDIRLARIKDKVLENNQLPEGEMLIKAKTNDDMHRENLALSLQGLIQSNLISLSIDADKTFKNTWLEFGSVIFKSLVSNPSEIISQTVTIRYYLPQEIQEEHIIKLEEGLETVFDVEKNALYVSGQISLEPGETKTLVVEVVDVWVISEEEITSTRKQADTLFESLKNTSYFAQGATLKSDIDVHLDKVAILQKSNQTPELKIKSYRSAMLELDSAKTKLDNLKTIVASAGSIGTVFGFVGGVQTIAVWGLVIILIAGFVFLMLYLKMISRNKTQTVAPDTNNITNQPSVIEKSSQADDLSIVGMLKDIVGLTLGGGKQKNKVKGRFLILSLISIIVILLFVIIALATNVQNQKQALSSLNTPVTDQPIIEEIIPSQATKSAKASQINEENVTILGVSTQEAEPATAEAEVADLNDDQSQLYYVSIPEGYKAINVRAEPSSDAPIIGRLISDQKVYLINQKDGWSLIKTNNIDLETQMTGWILQSLISEIP